MSCGLLTPDGDVIPQKSDVMTTLETNTHLVLLIRYTFLMSSMSYNKTPLVRIPGDLFELEGFRIKGDCN